VKGRGALSILSNCRVAIVLWDVKTRNREKYLKRTRKCTFQVVLPGDKYTLRRLVRAPHHNGSRCFRSRQYGYGGGEYPGRSAMRSRSAAGSRRDHNTRLACCVRRIMTDEPRRSKERLT